MELNKVLGYSLNFKCAGTLLMIRLLKKIVEAKEFNGKGDLVIIDEIVPFTYISQDFFFSPTDLLFRWFSDILTSIPLSHLSSSFFFWNSVELKQPFQALGGKKTQPTSIDTLLPCLASPFSNPLL